MTDQVSQLQARIRDLELQILAADQRRAFERIDAMGDCPAADSAYVPGCGSDDRYDSKGERLLPRVNEAGEPSWM